MSVVNLKNLVVKLTYDDYNDKSLIRLQNLIHAVVNFTGETKKLSGLFAFAYILVRIRQSIF